MNKLVRKVINKHLSLAQVFGFFLANLIGLTILFGSLSFYLDCQKLFEEKVEEGSTNKLVINKVVRQSQSLRLGSNDFSLSEIKQIKKQDFIKEVGLFSSAHYSVTAGINMGISLYTYIFFESVDDKYLDIHPDNWDFHEGQTQIPIILPRSYLTLYNSVFAISQGLPKLSDHSIKQITLSIQIQSKDGHTENFEGRIVGFSKQLNTILVPQKFMDWSNNRFAPNRENKPSRLILQVKDASNPKLLKYLKDEDYEVQDHNLISAQAKFIFQVISLSVVAIGAVISALAFYLLLLSMLLLIQKSHQELEDLLLLGYAKKLIKAPFYRMSLIATSLASLLALVATIILQGYYMNYLRQIYPSLKVEWINYGYILALALGMSLFALSLTAITLWRRMPRLPHKA